MKKTQPKLSWKPRRIGDRYCAPACGNGCTHQEYTEATEKAKALAFICGNGWKPDVWENLGWHYRVISPCGRIKLYPGYTAFLSPKGDIGGEFCEHGKTPRSAIQNTLKVAKARIAYYNSLIKDL